MNTADFTKVLKMLKKIFKNLSEYWILFSVFLMASLCGCDSNNRDLDPKQVGRFSSLPAVNVILNTLGVEDEEPPAYAGATEPEPEDSVFAETDYTIGAGDILRLSIFELLIQNQPYVDDFVVSETGKINVPEVGVVDVLGLTERQVEEELRNILRPNILKEPIVIATLLRSQKLMYSISGAGVRTPGRYPIPRYDFRLLDAIALAEGIGQFNVSYVYVSRIVKSKQPSSNTVGPEMYVPTPTETPQILEQDLLKMLTPISKEADVQMEDRPVMQSAEFAVEEGALQQSDVPEELELLSGIVEASKKAAQETTGQTEWIFQDGKWVPVEVDKKIPIVEITKPQIEPQPVIEEKEITEKGVTARLIKIPAEKLMTGDPKYNIVIKDCDSISVPVDLVGEFSIMGNVNGQGVINMTGRPLTLKMAIAAAGGLGELAWPKHCEITRRIGKDREETVMVDLDKIYRGEQPDFFIKPNDLINVGTHPTAQFRAQLRNAFRATYGFAFLYDRNFGNRDFGFEKPLGPFGF